MIHRVSSTRAGFFAVSMLLMTGGACEGESSSFSQFVGVWEYVSGTQTEKCMPATAMDETVDLKGAFIELKEGVDSPLVTFGFPWLEVDCLIRLDVNGNTATAKPGQSCKDSVSSANVGRVSITNEVTSFNFTVAGVNGSEMSMGKLELKSASATLTCNSTITGMLKKVAQ